MNLIKQLKLPLVDSLVALTRLRKKSFLWLSIYGLSAIFIFGLIVWQMLIHEIWLKNILLDYFFPKSWHSLSQKLVDFLYQSQTKFVISNLILSGSLVLASIFLFPIKEKYSAVFEKEANFNNGEADEFPLLYQVWEEFKLLILYFSAQSVILWIGYYPYWWTTAISITLSYFFLFFTFGLDFISPTLQRHRVNYFLILKALLSRPIPVILFGLVFSLPTILLSQVIFTNVDFSLIEIASILFIVNIFFLTLAVPAGTYVASELLTEVRETIPPKKKSVYWGFSCVTVLLGITLLLHTQLIMSLHHKSQLLKANYDIDWSSMSYDFPSWAQLTQKSAITSLSFDMLITNSTEYDIEIEASQILVEQRRNLVATVDLSGFKLPAGESHRVSIKLDSNSNLSLVSDINSILDDWRVDMHLQIWPGIPFVWNIIET